MTIKEKLLIYWKPVLTRYILEKIITATGKRYRPEDLTRNNYIEPIRKGQAYWNMLSWKPKLGELVAAWYVGDSDYMIGGMSVYNMYGFTTQLAQETKTYTTSISREVQIFWQRYVFSKINDTFLYGWEERSVLGYQIRFMSRERAFIEYVRERFLQPEKDFLEIYESLSSKKLESLLIKYPLKNIIKKIGKIWILFSQK